MQLLSVNYHYFRDIKPSQGIYPISLEEFEKQIDELSKYYHFISQEDLVNKIRYGIYDKKKYCLLTFDDGLKEQMQALDILNKKGIPGVFYVTTSSIKNLKVVNTHKLHYIRSIISDEKVYEYVSKHINLDNVEYPQNIAQLYRYDSLDTKKLKYLLNFILEENVKNKIIDSIFKELTDEQEFSKKIYMDINDIKKLDSIGYLGTHSDLHLPLATLNKNQIRDDISNSIDFLKNECNVKNIHSISYPYGGASAVSQDVADVAKEFDFVFGLTMFRGLNDMGNLKNPLMLKRVDTNDAPGGKFNSTEFCI